MDDTICPFQPAILSCERYEITAAIRSASPVRFDGCVWSTVMYLLM